MKKLGVLFLVLLWFCSLVCMAQTEDNNPLAMGQRALRNNELDAAKRFLEKAYKEAPKDSVVLLAYAETCIRLNDPRKAESILKDGIELFPTMSDFYLKLGVARNLQGEFGKAVDAFAKARDLMPKDAAAQTTRLINQGLAIMYDQRPLDAIPLLDSALELSPRNATAYNYRGAALYMVQDYVQCIDAYDAAIDIDNRNALSFYNRGMAYMKLNKKSEACADFHMGCKLGNKNACKVIVVDCKK